MDISKFCTITRMITDHKIEWFTNIEVRKKLMMYIFNGKVFKEDMSKTKQRKKFVSIIFYKEK